jgi:hypothetical protein
MIPQVIGYVPKTAFKRWRERSLAMIIALLALEWACAQPSADASKISPSQEEAGEKMTITGRLIGPNDKPVAGGQVAVVVAQDRRSERPTGTFMALGGLAWEPKLLGTAKAGEEGRFCLSGPRYSASKPYAPLATLFAAAPGYGLAGQLVEQARLHQEVSVKLLPERVVRGRLIDLQGQPAAGVRVNYAGSAEDWRIREEKKCVPFWPKPVTTDDKGRFLLRGLGLRKATLEINHERFAPQRLEVETGERDDGKEATLSLVGARNLRGRVTYADTGKPAAKLQVFAVALEDERGAGLYHVEGQTDEQGQFFLNTFPGNYQFLIIHPPPGSSYLTLRQFIPWAQAARERLELALPRGILVHGVVTEQYSRKPVAGARLQFRPRENNNPFFRRDNFQRGEEEYYETAISDPNGRFQLGALPGPGHLLVLAPTLDYLPVETSRGEFEYGKPGGIRYYPDAMVKLDLQPGTEAHQVGVELRRGVTIEGRVVRPDDKPVDCFELLCRHYWPNGYKLSYYLVEGRDGRFELPGCDPEKHFRAWLLAPRPGLGATVVLSAKKAAGQPVTVRLERCGSAVARFADQDGKPLVKHRPFFQIVITPGVFASPSFEHDDKKELEADSLNLPYWVGIFPFWKSDSPYANLLTDPDGRITFPTLIPGATYRIALPNSGTGKAFWDEGAIKGFPTRDFTVKLGEKLVIPETLRERKVEVIQQ